MKEIIWGIVLIGLAVVLLCVRIILKKNGRFSSQHISQSKAMRERGIHCVNTQDYEERHKKNKLNNNKIIYLINDFDLNNDLGLPDTMNADECCAVLYSYGDFTNLESMIASIREIAKNIPGFTAFHQMADYLEENGDFAYEIYRTFGKAVINRVLEYEQ